MKKWLAMMLVALVAFGALVGCGKKDESKKESEATDGKIVVYSNSLTDEREKFLKEVAAEKGLEIELVGMGGNDLYNRIIAEKDAPIADVVFGMNQILFSQIADQDILEAYEPNWLGDVDSDLVAESHLYSPLQEQRVFIVYNKDKMNEADVAKDWQDLANNDKYKGKYIVPDSLGGATASAIVYNILMNYRDEKGEMGISKKGWDQLAKVLSNGKTPSEGQNSIDALANGDADFSYTFLSNVPVVEESLGIKLGIIDPSYGVPQTVEQVGLIKKDKMNAKAKEFIDFLGSEEVQSEWAKRYGSAPVNKKAQAATNPRINDILKMTTPQKNDYKFISKHLSEWVEHIELNLLGN
ncbi:extracellular solute-binding protein [Atopobacter phocae]|uniref:extracellular solute-binding protein n=1 Tax=Atopobacter phocae TaxID=136492 RepID=UPI0004711954|nr:extracellular solute-binding protein [Atopobacter phocae]